MEWQQQQQQFTAIAHISMIHRYIERLNSIIRTVELKKRVFESVILVFFYFSIKN